MLHEASTRSRLGMSSFYLHMGRDEIDGVELVKLKLNFTFSPKLLTKYNCVALEARSTRKYLN